MVGEGFIANRCYALWTLQVVDFFWLLCAERNIGGELGEIFGPVCEKGLHFYSRLYHLQNVFRHLYNKCLKFRWSLTHVVIALGWSVFVHILGLRYTWRGELSEWVREGVMTGWTFTYFATHPLIHPLTHSLTHCSLPVRVPVLVRSIPPPYSFHY